MRTHQGILQFATGDKKRYGAWKRSMVAKQHTWLLQELSEGRVRPKARADEDSTWTVETSAMDFPHRV